MHASTFNDQHLVQGRYAGPVHLAVVILIRAVLILLDQPTRCYVTTSKGRYSVSVQIMDIGSATGHGVQDSFGML
jgi:hypothetical protein